MKYIKILSDTWEFLENNYKGSEITFEKWLDLIEEKSDSKNCLKQCINILWNNWEFYSNEEKAFYMDYIQEYYHIKVK